MDQIAKTIKNRKDDYDSRRNDCYGNNGNYGNDIDEILLPLGYQITFCNKEGEIQRRRI